MESLDKAIRKARFIAKYDASFAEEARRVDSLVRTLEGIKSDLEMVAEVDGD
jgi:hypothetical protein